MIEKSYFYADNSASFLNIIVKFHPEVTISIALQEKKVFVNRLKITKLIQKCHIFVMQLTVFLMHYLGTTGHSFLLKLHIIKKLKFPKRKYNLVKYKHN